MITLLIFYKKWNSSQWVIPHLMLVLPPFSSSTPQPLSGGCRDTGWCAFHKPIWQSQIYSCSSLNLPAWSKPLCALKTTVFGVLKSQSNWNKEMFLRCWCVAVQVSMLLHPSTFQTAPASYWRDTHIRAQIISIFSFLSASLLREAYTEIFKKDETKGQKAVF